MDRNMYVLNCVRKDIELKLKEHLSCVIDTNLDIEEIGKKIDIQKLEQQLLDKYNQPAESVDIKFSNETEELWATFNITDYDEYDKIIQNLHNSRNTTVQIRALNKLLAAYIIDTKQKSWLSLARNLQQCLISSSNEVFEKSLRIHFKLISMPNTCSEGYLNLVHTLIIMFNSEVFKNCDEINETRKVHKRTLNILKLLLKTQKILLKNWLHTKHKVIEEIMITFIYMLNYSLGGEHDLGALDFLAFLDSEAKWFKKYCYSVQTRNIILACLKKTHSLIDYFINHFVNYIDDNYSHSRNHRQFLNFSHSSHVLMQYFTFRQSFSVFPVKIRGSHEIITFEYFVFIIVTKINNWNESPRRRILVELLQCFLINHFSLILNPDIHRKLFEPLMSKNLDKKLLLATVEKSSHILDILNDLSKSHYSKIILYNLTDLKKSEKKYRRNTSSTKRTKCNILQIIVNITIACIRNFINSSETQHYVNSLIFELTDCCRNMFESHARTFISVNASKLITALRDFYKTVMNHNTNSVYYKSQIAGYLCFFIENYYATVKILESESGFVHEIVYNALMNTNSLLNESNSHGSNLILNIANYKEGNEIVRCNFNILVKGLLMDIWSVEYNEENYLTGLNVNFDLKVNKYLHMVHILSYSFSAIKALLDFDSEGTVVENQGKPLSLSELVENCLNLSSLGNTDTILGLKTIKILITNADILLFLQNNHKLQETLIELQVNSRMPCDDDDGFSEDGTAILIDECSSLCHNILLSIKYYGRVDVILDEKLLDQTQLVVAPNPRSSSLRRYQKTPSELQKFLQDSKSGLHDYGWLSQARRAFKTSCRENYKISVLVDLIEQAAKIGNHQSNFVWPSVNTNLRDLFPEEQYGITLIVRFGIQNGILHSSLSNENNLNLLLKQSRKFSGCKLKEFLNFDWFVAAVFLICAGNLEKSKTTLINVSHMPVASIIWPALYNGDTEKKQTICDNFYRQLEIILQDTTKLACALQTLGTSPKHIVQKWLNQCFFNVLHFSEVCNFISMAIVFPPEYVLFFMLAVLEHIKSDIFTLTHTSNIVNSLKVTKALDFRISDYFTFMDKLHKQYRNILQL